MGLTKERMVFFMSILQTTELKKYYGSKPNITKALDGVTLSIEDGEFVAIVGTSGSGKSTLLNMMGGLDRPTSGSIEVKGKELSKLKDEQLTIFRRRNIGFIFQNYNLVPVLNVYENIVLPVELDGDTVDKHFMNEVVKMLQSVGMTGRQVKQMLIYEGIGYSILGLLGSLILSVIASLTVVRMMGAELTYFTWHFTLIPVFLCIIPLILITAIVPLVCYNKMAQKTVVERLRLAE